MVINLNFRFLVRLQKFFPKFAYYRHFIRVAEKFAFPSNILLSRRCLHFRATRAGIFASSLRSALRPAAFVKSRHPNVPAGFNPMATLSARARTPPDTCTLAKGRTLPGFQRGSRIPGFWPPAKGIGYPRWNVGRSYGGKGCVVSMRSRGRGNTGVVSG